MVKHHSSEIQSDRDLASGFRSSDLLLMMMRILAIKEHTPTLRVWRHRPELDVPIAKWLFENFSCAVPCEKSSFYLVSNCLTPARWNMIDYSAFGPILGKPRCCPDFTMQCLSSPYIAVSEIGINEEIPASYVDNGKRMANRMFSLLYEAALRRDGRFCLHRSDKMLTAHWAASGGRMVIGELDSLEKMESAYSVYTSVICVEGPAAVIDGLAKTEFLRQTANAADTAVLDRELMKNSQGHFQRLVEHSNQIPPNTSYKLARLDPAFEDMNEVIHFLQKMRKVGNFLLAEPRAILKASMLSENIVDNFLEQDYETA